MMIDTSNINSDQKFFSASDSKHTYFLFGLNWNILNLKRYNISVPIKIAIT